MYKELRSCKCHWQGEQYLHWGRSITQTDAAERSAFCPPHTPLRFAGEQPIRCTQLQLKLHINFDQERIYGTTTHSLVVQAASVSTVVLDAVQLQMGEVKVNGEVVEAIYDGSQLTIPLAAAAKRNETLQVEVTHSTTRPLAGFYFTTPSDAYPDRFHTAWSQGQDEDSRYYFPCLDAPHQKQPVEVILYVPEGYFALSNGALVEDKTEGAEHLWHYRFDLPCSTYLVSVVAGVFSCHEEKGVIPVKWYVQPGREQEGMNAFGETQQVLAFLADFCGVPYPGAHYTQIAVPDFIFGGMENFTVTTQTDMVLHDDRAHLDFSARDLVSHEAAHSWFGNWVTARSWAHAWLHESFATYCESLYLAHCMNEQERDYQLLCDAEAYFHEDTLYRRPLVTERYQQPIDLFDAHLYPGGAVRLRNLHCLLGDEHFRASIKRYLETHGGSTAETIDLMRAIEAETAQNLQWWFHQWIFCGGYPHLDIQWSWSQESAEVSLQIEQKTPLFGSASSSTSSATSTSALGSTGESLPEWFRLPLTIALQEGNQLQRFDVVVDAEKHRWQFPAKKRPSMAITDIDFTCPALQLTQKKPQDWWVTELHKAPSLSARIAAANALAEQPSETVCAELSKALQEEVFWGVQQRIAKALGRLGGAQARDALLNGLKLAHPKARRAVVETLGYFRDDQQVGSALSNFAKTGDASYFVEAELARALGRCRADGARLLLTAMLKKPSHNEVIARGALAGLSLLGDAEGLTAIINSTQVGQPILTRSAALKAAAGLGKRHVHCLPQVLEVLEQTAEGRGDPAGQFRLKLAAIEGMEALAQQSSLACLQRVKGYAVDGRIAQRAALAIDIIQRQYQMPQQVLLLHDDLTRLTSDNRLLRDRLDALERRTMLPTP